MEEKDIFKRLEKIIRDTGNIGKKEITLETNLRKDLGLNSLDECEIFYLAEEEFKISIPDYEMDGLETMKDYTDYIINYQSKHSKG